MDNNIQFPIISIQLIIHMQLIILQSEWGYDIIICGTYTRSPLKI